MLELTPNYLENPYADVFVYFSSSLFDSDSPSSNPLISGYHGQSLSQWLRKKLTTHGYTVLEAAPNSASWTFVYVNCQYRWDILCENIIRHHTNEWKITINSTTKDAQGAGGTPPEECLEFLKSIKVILESEPDIHSIEWNRAILNQ